MAQMTYDISELAERYDEAFALAARGEEVIVVAPGHPPVRLVPTLKPRVLDMHPGSMVMAADFNDPLPDEFWLGDDSDPVNAWGREKLERDAATLAAHAERVLPLATAALCDEYYYQSLPLCVIDAVFSIGVRYSGVRRVVARYCDHTKQRRIRNREGPNPPPIAEQEAISTFCARPEQADPVAMAVNVYGSRQRTSTKSGILKAEAAARFASCLRAHGVEYFQDLPRVARSRRFRDDIRAIPGQGSGISLRYFWMLAGSDEFIKPDRMVRRFLAAALNRPVGVRESSSLMRATCERLKPRFPHLTPRLLDYEVWKFQRGEGRSDSPVCDRADS